MKKEYINMDKQLLSVELPTDTTMEVTAVYRQGTKKYFDAICPDCKDSLYLRADAIKLGGYKEQQCCRKCSYIRRDGIDQKGYSMKYPKLKNTYYNMLSRCCDPLDSSYHNYGAKGVTVVDDWKNSFTTFVEWCLKQGFTYEELCTRELDKDLLCEELAISPAQYGPTTCKFVSRHFNSVIKPKQAGTSSQYIGVNWGKSTGRWEWGIRLSTGKRKRGYGLTELEAAQKREQYIIDNNLSHRRNYV